MATELAKAYVQIIPSADGIKQQLTEILGDEMPSGEAPGKSWSAGLISGIKKVIAAAGIGKAFAESLNQGAELQQSIGGVETLFKDSAGKVKEYASQAYKTAGLSANEYMQTVTSFSASLLQSMGNDTEAAAEKANMALTDMSDNANKMGTDMESIQNAYQGFAKQNYTMLDNLKLGYGGTKEEMERLLKDAQAISGVEYDVSSYADVVDAIHVIQTEMGITGTTALEASETFSGSLASMQAAAKDLLGNLALGENIGTSLRALADTTYTFLVGNLIPMVGDIFSGLPEMAAMAPSLLQGGTDAALSLVKGLTSGLSGNVSSFLSQALPMVMEFSGQLRANAGQLVDAGLNLIIELANGLINSLPALIQTIPTIVSNIAGIINDNAPKLIITAGTLLLNLASGLIQSLPVLVQEAPKIVSAIADVVTAFNWLDLGKTVLTGIQNGVKALPGKLKELVDSAVKNIKESFQGGGIVNVVKSVVSSVKSIFTDGFTALKTTATNVWNSIKTAITNPIQTAKDTVKNLIDKIKGFFNFSWSLPKLKMPHVTITGSFSLVPPSVPKFSISWYRSAMDNPLLLTNASIFGAAGGSLLGGGEAGPEVVSGADTLMNMIRSVLNEGSADPAEELGDKVDRMLELLTDYLPQLANVRVYLDKTAMVGQMAPAMDTALGKLQAKGVRQG